MWVLTGNGNLAALATYARAGGTAEREQAMFGWTFGPG